MSFLIFSFFCLNYFFNLALLFLISGHSGFSFVIVDCCSFMALMSWISEDCNCAFKSDLLFPAWTCFLSLKCCTKINRVPTAPLESHMVRTSLWLPHLTMASSELGGVLFHLRWMRLPNATAYGAPKITHRKCVEVGHLQLAESYSSSGLWASWKLIITFYSILCCST